MVCRLAGAPLSGPERFLGSPNRMAFWTGSPATAKRHPQLIRNGQAKAIPDEYGRRDCANSAIRGRRCRTKTTHRPFALEKR